MSPAVRYLCGADRRPTARDAFSRRARYPSETRWPVPDALRIFALGNTYAIYPDYWTKAFVPHETLLACLLWLGVSLAYAWATLRLKLRPMFWLAPFVIAGVTVLQCLAITSSGNYAIWFPG